MYLIFYLVTVPTLQIPKLIVGIIRGTRTKVLSYAPTLKPTALFPTSISMHLRSFHFPPFVCLVPFPFPFPQPCISILSLSLSLFLSLSLCARDTHSLAPISLVPCTEVRTRYTAAFMHHCIEPLTVSIHHLPFFPNSELPTYQKTLLFCFLRYFFGSWWWCDDDVMMMMIIRTGPGAENRDHDTATFPLVLVLNLSRLTYLGT